MRLFVPVLPEPGYLILSNCFSWDRHVKKVGSKRDRYANNRGVLLPPPVALERSFFGKEANQTENIAVVTFSKLLQEVEER